MKTTMKILAAAVSMGVALSSGAAALAQAQPAGSINELLNRVRADVREASQENQQRLNEFQSSRNQQQSLLNQARGELASLERRSDQLTAEFEGNQVRIDELAEILRQRQGAFGEVFGTARQVAGEFAAIIDGSIISAQYPGRAGALEALATSNVLPTRDELDYIPRRVIEEMIYQQSVTTFQSRVLGINDGQPVTVNRVGPFVAFSSTGAERFALWSQDDATGEWRLADLARQPDAQFIAGASTLANADPGEIVMGVIDPSRGPLLEIYKDVPNLQERIDQSGNVGLVIIGLLIGAGAFGLFRIFQLFMTMGAVGGQKRSPNKPKKGNPLGRVMLAYESAKGGDVETVELKLDNAILQETPKLEFGLNFLKLAAGIAPLLGLLGTVTGMIKTFTQITLFGTGDPKVMAGGISEALMTTVLGLIAAIPLLFIHSFAASFARGVQQVLEEQAAGIVARHAEESNG